MNQRTETPVIIYHDGDKAVEVRLDTGQETVWLSQAQMANLFGRDQSVVSRHIRTAFQEGELERMSTVQKMHVANSLEFGAAWRKRLRISRPRQSYVLGGDYLPGPIDIECDSPSKSKLSRMPAGEVGSLK